MHVLFVIDTWGLIGGTERHAAVVVPALLERGHRISVLCRENQHPPFAPEAEVLEVPELGQGWLSKAQRRDLGRRLRGVRPDVVFLSALRNVDAAEELAETAPVVRYVHDHTLFCPGLNKYREDGQTCRDAMGLVCLQRYWLDSGCICFKPAGHPDRFLTPIREIRARWRELEVTQRSARVLTNSHYMRDELLKVGFAPERTDVLYIFTRSNTDEQPAGELPAETRAFLEGGDAPVVFTPARLTLPDKGVDFLISALAGVRAPFRAVVAGSGPAEDWLRQKAQDDGVGDRVHFTGWMPSEGIEALYAVSDLVVCPSVWDEPFGLVGLEAMAHGKPVVAFDVGGIPEWLQDGRTGHLVPRQDVGTMAARIDELLADPGRARELGEAGRASLEERFPRAGHIDALEGVLASAAG